jgi:hypothetical protein
VIGRCQPLEELVEVRRALGGDDHRRSLDRQQLQARTRDDARQPEPAGCRLEQLALLMRIEHECLP